MTDLESWLIGNAEKITDIEFLARVIVLICLLSFFSAVASDLMSIGKR